MIRSPFNMVDLCCEGFVDFPHLQDLSLKLSLLTPLYLFLTGVMHEADNSYLIRSTWLRY